MNKPTVNSNWGVDMNNCASAAMKKATSIINAATPENSHSLDAACALMTASAALLEAGARFMGGEGKD